MENKENKMLALKVYDVDYSFIIKNYLDEKLWEKEWVIFVYKKFKVNIQRQKCHFILTRHII